MRKGMHGMRNARLRSCWTHHARSSSAAGSNSKLLSDFVKRDASRSILGLEQAFAHGVALEEVGRFAFRFDFTPNVDRDNHGDGVAAFVGDDLQW